MDDRFPPARPFPRWPQCTSRAAACAVTADRHRGPVRRFPGPTTWPGRGWGAARRRSHPGHQPDPSSGSTWPSVCAWTATKWRRFWTADRRRSHTSGPTFSDGFRPSSRPRISLLGSRVETSVEREAHGPWRPTSKGSRHRTTQKEFASTKSSSRPPRERSSAPSSGGLRRPARRRHLDPLLQPRWPGAGRYRAELPASSLRAVRLLRHRLPGPPRGRDLLRRHLPQRAPSRHRRHGHGGRPRRSGPARLPDGTPPVVDRGCEPLAHHGLRGHVRVRDVRVVFESVTVLSMPRRIDRGRVSDGGPGPCFDVERIRAGSAGRARPGTSHPAD